MRIRSKSIGQRCICDTPHNHVWVLRSRLLQVLLSLYGGSCSIMMMHIIIHHTLLEFQHLHGGCTNVTVAATTTASTSSPNIILERFWNRRKRQRYDRRNTTTEAKSTTTSSGTWMQNDSSNTTNTTNSPNAAATIKVGHVQPWSPHPLTRPETTTEDESNAVLRADVENATVEIPSFTTAIDRKKTQYPNAFVTTTTIISAIQKWFHQHRHSSTLLQLFVRRVLQYGIGCYLVLEFCKAVQSTIEEMNETTYFPQDEDDEHQDHPSSSSLSSSSRPHSSSTAAYAQYPRMIKDIVHQLQQQESSSLLFEANNANSTTGRPLDRTALRSTSSTSTAPTAPYQTIYSLAQWLHSAGIPYCHRNTDKIRKRDSPDSVSLSVESLLMELTHSEIALLQQCLYVVPNVNDMNGDCTTSGSHYLRRNLIGLESIHAQIVDTIQNSLGRNHHLNTDGNSTTIANPFASLFHDVTLSTSTTESSNKNNNIGILLYGPPGCGKTNLIRTLVQTLQLPCLIITPSILLRKYVGETNLHIRTLFHMVQNKLSPCILCIDELDGLFRERQPDYNEHEVNRELKTEFLQWMDGMMTTATTSSENRKHRNPLIMIGATNRPFDVDAAIIRRLSHTYYVGLPNADQRRELFMQFLQPIPNSIIGSHLPEIVAITAGYTPSDLRQLLQVAAVSGPLKRPSSSTPKLSLQDVMSAMSVIGPTPLSANYEQQMRQFRSQRNPVNVDRFGNKKSGNSLYMDNDDDPDTSRNDPMDRPFSLAFMDRSNAMEHNNDDSSPTSDRWETIFGNFYDIGTLEMDEATLDLLLQCIRHVVQQSDENHNSDNDNNHGD